jgi:hypothetical protein
MEKNQAQKEIEALADVFGIATDGFDAFYKKANDSKNGYYSTAASSGDYSTAASSGNYSKAASSGNSSACSALGYRAAVKGDIGNLLMASEYIKKDGNIFPVGGKADLVDGKTLKPDRWYIVENAKWVEVDFTDGIFARVLSHRGGAKKVKTEDGRVLFIVTDENGNSAHGETIAKAREDLIFKVVAKFDEPLPEKATGKEWIGIYRAVTGACASGVKMFVDEMGKSLDDEYAAKQIAEMVKGRFGHDKFIAKLGE